ncbi:MAG: hypothetical protein JWO98_4401 [Frankiales bacterium]|nr:hypothetical protein [Frankiales bacterium]
MTLRVGPVSPEEYLAALGDRPASFLQSPSWSTVKTGWAAEHLAWRDESGDVVGAGLVLLRRLPLIGRSLAVLTEGPVVDWAAHGTQEVLAPLAEYVRERGAFGLRIGPDVVHRRWRADTVKDAVGSGRLRNVEADLVDPVGARLIADLGAAGWVRAREDDGLPASTRHSFHVSLAGRTEDDLFAAMNQQWRRGIRKAEKAGVVVERGTAADLPDFHRVYAETGRRDGFAPHGLEHFQRMWAALSAEGPERIRLYLARHEGEVLAGMVVVVIGGLAGYAYGGSAGHKREMYPSNATHWRILRDLLAEGVDVYDMRGIGDGLDPENPKFGLLRFKVGTGGEAVEYVSDWDLAVRPMLHPAGMAVLRAAVRARSVRSRLRGRRPAALVGAATACLRKTLGRPTSPRRAVATPLEAA